MSRWSNTLTDLEQHVARPQEHECEFCDAASSLAILTRDDGLQSWACEECCEERVDEPTLFFLREILHQGEDRDETDERREHERRATGGA